MNTKLALTLALLATVVALAVADFPEGKVAGYAEKFVECLSGCTEKYGKAGYKKQYPQKEGECKLTCDEKFSTQYGSFGFYPEKNDECHQRCNEVYPKKGSKTVYPEKNAECHQRCNELYGFRKPLKNVE